MYISKVKRKLITTFNKYTNFYFNNHIIKSAFQLLAKGDKFKLILIVILQIFLGLIDLIGVGLIGILGALSVTGIQANSPGERVSNFLRIFSLENLSFQKQLLIIGFCAALFMVLKTMLSILFTRKALSFLGRRSAYFSGELLKRITSQQYSLIKENSKQDTIYKLTAGANSLIMGILGAVMTILADATLILVMLFGLFAIEWQIAISSLCFFSLVGFFLHRNLSIKAENLGVSNSVFSVKVNESIAELLDTYRELFVRGRVSLYIRDIQLARMKIAEINSGMAFLPYVSKYVLEISVVCGVLLLAIFQFLFEDTGRAVGNLALFIAAGSRIVPAILRLQQGFLQIRSSMGGAKPTLDLYNKIPKSTSTDSKGLFSTNFLHEGFESSLEISNIDYSYPGSLDKSIKNISLKVPSGALAAIVGKSGAGKSTLADLILGVLQSTNGDIKVSNCNPIDAINRWPGAISYVPQDVVIISTSIFENITLGVDVKTVEIVERVWQTLKLAQLDDFVKKMPRGLETIVGENGAKLSGGQKQRLGIARALFTNPKFIIMDEATSSLDSETENALNAAIQNLRGSTTLIVIAHRLATVRNADIVYYLNEGKLEFSGSFDEVRNNVVDFDLQAKLLGL